MSQIPNNELTEEVNAILEEFSNGKPQDERVVFPVDDTHILIGTVTYEIIEDYRDGFDIEAMNARYQDILARYDYIVGDWGHDKLRLKGFFKHTHRLATPDRDITYLQDYLNEYCNFGCQYFVLERDPKAVYVPIEEEVIPRRPKQKQANRKSQRKADKQVRAIESHQTEQKKVQSKDSRGSQTARTQKKQARFNIKENNSSQDFGLKEITQKETFKTSTSSENSTKQRKQKRTFQMKEVEQSNKVRMKNTKPSKQNPKKRFDIREKQQKRGQ